MISESTPTQVKNQHKQQSFDSRNLIENKNQRLGKIPNISPQVKNKQQHLKFNRHKSNKLKKRKRNLLFRRITILFLLNHCNESRVKRVFLSTSGVKANVEYESSLTTSCNDRGQTKSKSKVKGQNSTPKLKTRA